MNIWAHDEGEEYMPYGEEAASHSIRLECGEDGDFGEEGLDGAVQKRWGIVNCAYQFYFRGVEMR